MKLESIHLSIHPSIFLISCRGLGFARVHPGQAKARRYILDRSPICQRGHNLSHTLTHAHLITLQIQLPQSKFFVFIRQGLKGFKPSFLRFCVFVSNSNHTRVGELQLSPVAIISTHTSVWKSNCCLLNKPTVFFSTNNTDKSFLSYFFYSVFLTFFHPLSNSFFHCNLQTICFESRSPLLPPTNFFCPSFYSLS